MKVRKHRWDGPTVLIHTVDLPTCSICGADPSDDWECNEREALPDEIAAEDPTTLQKLRAAGLAILVAATGMVAASAQTVGPLTAFRNILDNGEMLIQQRGVTQVTGITNTAPIFAVQEIESTRVIPTQGQSMVCTAYIQAGATFSGTSVVMQVVTGTGTDQGLASLAAGTWTGQATNALTPATVPFTTSQGYTRIGGVFTMPVAATEAAFEVGYTPVGTAGATDLIYFTGAQCEQTDANIAMANQVREEDTP